MRFQRLPQSNGEPACRRLAVIGAIIGEYVAAEKGLGYLQLQANARFDTALNFATVVVISELGVALYFILSLIESRFVFQRELAK